jgi:cell division protein FtsW (lipid II flippase)
MMAPDQAQSEYIDYEEQPAFEPMQWQASEFVHHQKQFTWYLVFAVIVVILVGVAAVTHQWFSVAVFIAMAAALLVYANKPPRTLNYEINDHGVTVDQKFHPYHEFRSFSVISDVGWHTIELDTVQRFMPRLTILFDTKDFDQIMALLSQELPRVDRHPDFIERLAKQLKF